MKDNKPKLFSPEELGKWVVDKSRRYIEPKNATKCAEYVLAHSGKGGGIGKDLDDGSSIFHISHGKRNGDDGCTLFFASRDGGKYASIVGIGWHYKSQDDEYKLDFKRGSWNAAGKNIVKL